MKEINVSNCRFLNMSKECRAINNELCENIKDCYYKQREQLQADNEELRKDNIILKDILSYPKYTNENAYNELLRLSKAELIKLVIESHQHGENTSQILYRRLKEENNKYKQCIEKIEEICKTTTCDYSMDKIEEIMKLIKDIEENKDV